MSTKQKQDSLVHQYAMVFSVKRDGKWEIEAREFYDTEHEMEDEVMNLMSSHPGDVVHWDYEVVKVPE